MNPTTHSGAPRSRRRRFMTAGVIAAGLSIAGAGTAMAGDDTAAPGPLPIPEAEQSTMPDGYTAEQYDAFWGAGYSAADVETLNTLWGSEYTETKARAGQMILDGLTVPVAPTGPDEEVVTDPNDPSVAALQAQYEAFWAAGYTGEDAEALSALWQSEFGETKARAGQMIIDGQALPVAPTGATPSTAPAPAAAS